MKKIPTIWDGPTRSQKRHDDHCIRENFLLVRGVRILVIILILDKAGPDRTNKPRLLNYDSLQVGRFEVEIGKVLG